jgi:hypothetical protein
MADQNTSSNQKTERKSLQNSRSFSRKAIFSAILKMAAILKTCGKNCLTFFKFSSTHKNKKCSKKIQIGFIDTVVLKVIVVFA